MNCYVFDVHINCCFTYEKSEYNLVEFGPLNMINSQTLSEISAILQKISSVDVPKNWWIEFSTWRDFKALLRTGSMLSIHRVVKYMTENLENTNITTNSKEKGISNRNRLNKESCHCY